ncbi:ribosome modulation factor [Marinobacter nauticus]|uniref:Ribosome modulation factor n=1 Tax=Marinobacter nauticus TaxID=2743 RepID=A0A833NAT1_MARNT|nr:ribosome modulation factor [Marinobacter nauticus]KAE8545573.1 Ribosome modulation factor [Marinobacter nauticus]MEC8824020.1 ribosome modulation factor [Pseudomonadota bacterium]
MATDIKLGWDVEALNKAYRQGYMAGEMGMDKTRCPYRGEVIIAAWEAGWDDAGQVGKQSPQQDDDLFSRIA